MCVGKIKSVTGVLEEPGGTVSQAACVQCPYTTVGVLSGLNNSNNGMGALRLPLPGHTTLVV